MEQALKANSRLKAQTNDLVAMLSNRYKMFYRVKHSTRKNRIFYISIQNLAYFSRNFLRVTPQILKTQKEDYYAETSFAQDYGRP